MIRRPEQGLKAAATPDGTNAGMNSTISSPAPEKITRLARILGSSIIRYTQILHCSIGIDHYSGGKCRPSSPAR